jgi:hypothetical protein
VCERLLIEPTTDGVFVALGQNDLLATAFARLLLYTDAKALPAETDASEGWDYYLRCWRPGKPHPGTWATRWSQARAAVAAEDGPADPAALS